MDIKALIANTIVKKFKSLGFAGALRWRLLYWAYKITGWHIRAKEWDWVLNYLPPLGKWQEVRVLDVGTTSSLFIYEIERRGYRVCAIDKKPYQEPLPVSFWFHQLDIMTKFTRDFIITLHREFNFITCISVLEHIIDREKAIVNMCSLLKPGGRLLLTIPTEEYAQGHPWSGFTYDSLRQMLPMKCKIIEYTERAGQMCLAITKWI